MSNNTPVLLVTPVGVPLLRDGGVILPSSHPHPLTLSPITVNSVKPDTAVHVISGANISQLDCNNNNNKICKMDTIDNNERIEKNFNNKDDCSDIMIIGKNNSNNNNNSKNSNNSKNTINTNNNTIIDTNKHHKGMEPPPIQPPPTTPPPPPPPPPPSQQSSRIIKSLAWSEGDTPIDIYRPNGARLGPIDGFPSYYCSRKLGGGRRQQQLTLRGERAFESANYTYPSTITLLASTENNRDNPQKIGGVQDGTTTTENTHSSTGVDKIASINGNRNRNCFKKNKRQVSTVRLVAEQYHSDDRATLIKANARSVGVSVNLKIPSVRISSVGDNSKGCDAHDCGRHTNPRLGPISLEDDVFITNKDVDTPVSSQIKTTLKTRRYLDDRIRAMYSRRRLNVPASARSYSQRPRSSSHGRPHSSRASSRSSPCCGDDITDRAHHSMAIGLLARFRLVARMTIILIRLMKAIIENSNDLTTRSAAELQWLTVYGRDTEATMAFNKNLYSRDRVMTHIPEWAMNILQLEPECRTELHCRRLHALLRGLKSFDKFTDEIQMSLCRAFRLEIVTEGRILLKHGHIGVYFYFIYSGSVFVNAQDKAPDGKPFMRTITVLTRGQSFGELALLQDIKRTATVSVREKCELLVVDKEVFARVCPQIFEKELEEKGNVLSGMTLFPSKWWGPEAMRALSMEAQIQEFKINKVIVPDSSLEDWIYTCIEGKCQVIHCLSLLSKGSDSGDQRRKTSDIVLSEEIIDLLSSATSDVAKTNEREVDADIKEKLLSSLGLDYVATGKRRHAYVKDDVEKERLRAIQGLDDATTLTSLMKKREETRKGLVYLNVGVIEPGEVFDLHSLVRDDRDTPKQTSCLMLVSGGAKILKIRKAAFYEHASEQALEHTRTLASKQRFLSDESLIESYKEKKKWERYKTDVVHSVLTTKQSRGRGHSQRDTPNCSRAQTPRPLSQRHTRSPRTSRSDMSTTPRQFSQNGVDHTSHTPTELVIDAMQKENKIPQEQPGTDYVDMNGTHDERVHTTQIDLNNSNSSTSTDSNNKTESRVRIKEKDYSEVLEERSSALIVPSFDTDAIIIRRNPARNATPRGRVLRIDPSRPHTVHTRFSTR